MIVKIAKNERLDLSSQSYNNHSLYSQNLYMEISLYFKYSQLFSKSQVLKLPNTIALSHLKNYQTLLPPSYSFANPFLIKYSATGDCPLPKGRRWRKRQYCLLLRSPIVENIYPAQHAATQSGRRRSRLLNRIK